MKSMNCTHQVDERSSRITKLKQTTSTTTRILWLHFSVLTEIKAAWTVRTKFEL